MKREIEKKEKRYFSPSETKVDNISQEPIDEPPYPREKERIWSFGEERIQVALYKLVKNLKLERESVQTEFYFI